MFESPRRRGAPRRLPRLLRPACFLLPLAALLARPIASSLGQANPQTRNPPARAAADLAPFPPPSPGWSFPQHQTLTYAVEWRVFPAGTATVHLESDGNLEHITVVGDSQGAINLLFHVSDRFQATANRTTGCSETFSRQMIEGRRQVNSDQRSNAAHTESSYDERNLISRVHVVKPVPTPPCVTDMLSGLFYAGSQSLDPNSTFHLPVVSGNHVTGVTLHTEAREVIRAPGASYRAIRVQSTADSGPARNRGKLWIWYSDDARHLPVQMRARLFWGTLTFRLTAVQNQ